MKAKLTILALCYTTSLWGAVVEHVGSYNGWDSVTWNPIVALNDPDDGAATELDFVGDSSNPGAYWADNGTYVFFRVRLNTPTGAAGTFSGAHLILLDVDNYLYGTGFGTDIAGSPDYAFAWDSKSNDPTAHGLEMSVLSDRGATWKTTRMDDIDGDAGKKLVNDINGLGRTTDGYLRTVDGQSTINFGDTTFLDIAVSWDYLDT